MYRIVFYTIRFYPLSTSRKDLWTSPSVRIGLGRYEKEYPRSLFNKGVRAKKLKTPCWIYTARN